MPFTPASVRVGFVAKRGGKEAARLIAAGASDRTGRAMVVLLTGGVPVITNDTQSPEAILHSAAKPVSGASAASHATLTTLVNAALALLIASGSGHGVPATPLPAPLAGVGRASAITARIMGQSVASIMAPTGAGPIGGRTLAEVGYGRSMRFVRRLRPGLRMQSGAIIALFASLAV